ncbi:MAG: sensor domain-containing diguanylate cyclase [Candidatus Omnitrophota bacterium]
MTRKPKKQLSNSALLPLFFFFFIFFQIFFFSFSLRAHTGFLFFVAIAQIILIAFLFAVRLRIQKKRAEAEVKRQDYLEKNNLLEAEIETETSVLKAFQEKIINYSKLKDLTEKLSRCLSLEDTSETLSAETDRLFGDGDITTILYLFHSRTGELGLTSSQKGQMRINIKSKKGDLFDGWVVKTLQPLLVEAAKNDFRFDMDKAVSEEARAIGSLISTPLMIGNKALGILRVDTPQENCFKSDDLRFLSTIGDLGAVAIENAQLYERVEELAIKDGLTGLYLRRYLLARMTEEISREFRSKRELSFLMVDLDKFKDYNDHYGHMAGDILLRTVAMILQETFKNPGDLVSRFGGEEFAVLLPDCSKEKAIELADEVRKRIQKQEIILRKQKTRITVSIGVATFPSDARLREELIAVADNAMYRAKAKGRNRVCFME